MKTDHPPVKVIKKILEVYAWDCPACLYLNTAIEIMTDNGLLTCAVCRRSFYFEINLTGSGAVR